MLGGVLLLTGCSTPDSDDRRTNSDGPTYTAAPDPASVPAPLWEAGTRGDDPLENVKDTPYNNDGADAPNVEDSPNVDGGRAIRFSIPGGGKRTELEPDIARQREGDELYFGLAHYLPPEFPVDTEDWQVVAQWKNTATAAPRSRSRSGRASSCSTAASTATRASRSPPPTPAT